MLVKIGDLELTAESLKASVLERAMLTLRIPVPATLLKEEKVPAAGQPSPVAEIKVYSNELRAAIEALEKVANGY